MFDSIGWLEILVIVVAGLFILGPERLPDAAAWVGKTVRRVREYATGAREQLKQEMGPEFEQLRKPLEDLRELRNFDPKRAITKHLWDDEPTEKPNGHPAVPPARDTATSERPLERGERPPFDPDAT
ncbi:sec-independent protein translocase protein TatB [Saccharothrix saharensis]|uniref:Sec-independent protein translocase protein TatB n=1 Tax=Saccharothrix saharensis TaxID=571190 RepID=A0A543JDY8_9PSEU|nr:sec-independent translocase [Saccharothrix saharensis]TQM81065.1 sec-independent protein translocase protein TatB [Saccharothrix saharensis]